MLKKIQMLKQNNLHKIGKGLLLGILLTGCATQLPPVDRVIYKTTPIYGPTRPSLPPLGAHDLECLPKSVLKTLSERDTLRREYAENIEAVLKSTQQ